MSDAMFDTLKYSKTLIAGGMPQNQAETQAEALASVIDHQLVTKQDFKELQKELKSDIQELQKEFKSANKELKQEFKNENKELRQEFKNDMLALKNDLILRVGGMIGLAVAAMGLLLSFFH